MSKVKSGKNVQKKWKKDITKLKWNQEDKPWCSTWTDSSDQHMSGHWGFCAPVEQVGASLVLYSRHWPGTSHFHGHSFQELAQSTFSNTTHSCTESDFHICRAPSNYGFIEVSFNKQLPSLSWIYQNFLKFFEVIFEMHSAKLSLFTPWYNPCTLIKA